MFLLIVIIYFFSILFYYAKVYWKDIPTVAKDGFLDLVIYLVIYLVSPIYLLRCVLIEINLFRKYHCFEFNILDKNSKQILRTQKTITRRFWLQDVINNDFIEYCEGQLKDDECLSIESVTRSSSVEFIAYLNFSTIGNN